MLAMDILQKWLQRSGTPEEFESAALERKAAAFNLPVEKVKQKFGDRPFGMMTDKWREFVLQLREEDELWFFCSPPDTFQKKLGCQGFAILREGNIRATLVTLRT
jgi:hypothetical protein